MNKLEKSFQKALSASKQPRKARRTTVKRRGVHGAKGKGKDVYNIDELADMFDLSKWDDLDELNQDYFSDARMQGEKEALDEGKTEEEVEEQGYRWESAAQDELYGKWYEAVEQASEQTLNKIGVELVAKKPPKKSKWPYEFKIVPKKSWRDAVEKIVELVNGVGMFHFSSVKEFLDSGPYTMREAVLTHLHHAESYAEVYGDPSAKRIYEGYMR